ncbi:MAG: hypothetical protein U5L76_01335 [Patescibacteria group bacterium]|nr:hypothetical protein [Patescibacteria group bacterium]
MNTPENFSKPPQQELLPNIEAEKKPHYIIMITRHAERLPSGELSPEGIAHAKVKGEKLKDVEVLKSYASDHPSARTYETAENIGSEADIKSPLTGERYKTKKVKGIQYDVLDPVILKDAKLSIDENTLKEIDRDHPELTQSINLALAEGAPTKINSQGETMVDIEKLPKNIQQQIAPIRQKNQKLAFEKILNNPEAVQSMMAGLSHQIFEKELILDRYARVRKKKEQPPKKDVVININTHGLFIESLLKNTGIFVKPNGEDVSGIDNMDSDELGDYIQPAESIYLDIGTDPHNIPERIPVIFESERDVKGKVYIDSAKLEQYSKHYKAEVK